MKEKLLIGLVAIITILSGISCYAVSLCLVPKIKEEAKSMGMIGTIKLEDIYSPNSIVKEAGTEAKLTEKDKPDSIKGDIFKGVKIQNYDEYIEGTSYKTRDIVKKNKKQILKEFDEQLLNTIEFYGYVNTEPTPTLILKSIGVYDDSYHYTKVKVNTNSKKVLSVSYPEPEVFFKKDSIVNTGNLKEPGGNITYYIKIDNVKDYEKSLPKKVAKVFKKYIFSKANEYKDYHFVSYSKGILKLSAYKLSNGKQVSLLFEHTKEMMFISKDKYSKSYAFVFNGEEKKGRKK